MRITDDRSAALLHVGRTYDYQTIRGLRVKRARLLGISTDALGAPTVLNLDGVLVPWHQIRNLVERRP